MARGKTDDARSAEAEPELVRASEAVWVAAQKSAWSSLVMIPAQAALSTAALAKAVAAVGAQQRREKVEHGDLRSVPLAKSRSIAETLADRGRPYCRVVAVDCPLDSPAALLLACSASAAVLVLERDRTLLREAARVLELVGPERFVGAVVLSPSRE